MHSRSSSRLALSFSCSSAYDYDILLACVLQWYSTVLQHICMGAAVMTDCVPTASMVLTRYSSHTYCCAMLLLLVEYYCYCVLYVMTIAPLERVPYLC
jgi:hypothetical protein